MANTTSRPPMTLDPLSDVVVDQVAQAIRDAEGRDERGEQYPLPPYRPLARAAISEFLKATGEQEPMSR